MILNIVEQSLYDIDKLKYLFPSEDKCWRGIECGNGWTKLITDCMIELVDMDLEHRLRISLLKEKFGTLRIHMYITDFSDIDDTLWEVTHKITTNYEKLSRTTCENCGISDETVTCSGAGWIQTLCGTCRNA